MTVAFTPHKVFSYLLEAANPNPTSASIEAPAQTLSEVFGPKPYKGRPLPVWLRFDPHTLSLAGNTSQADWEREELSQGAGLAAFKGFRVAWDWRIVFKQKEVTLVRNWAVSGMELPVHGHNSRTLQLKTVI